MGITIGMTSGILQGGNSSSSRDRDNHPLRRMRTDCIDLEGWIGRIGRIGGRRRIFIGPNRLCVRKASKGRNHKASKDRDRGKHRGCRLSGVSCIRIKDRRRLMGTSSSVKVERTSRSTFHARKSSFLF